MCILLRRIFVTKESKYNPMETTDKDQIYAMVGINDNLGNRGSDKRRLGKRCSATAVPSECDVLVGVFFR